MFYLSSTPDLYKQAPRITIEGHGQIYYIYKDGNPYLEIEIGSGDSNPFNTECFFYNHFCIGSGENVYFVNLHTQETKTLSCDMYFGDFYTNKDRLYVASSSRLSCFDPDCEPVWKSEAIAVDGVVVDEFLSDRILVSCEVDPPGHWIQCRLSIHNGTLLS